LAAHALTGFERGSSRLKIGLVGLLGVLMGLVGLVGLVGLAGLAGLVGLVGLVRLVYTCDQTTLFIKNIHRKAKPSTGHAVFYISCFDSILWLNYG
jgi:hypothetical protein